MAELTYRMIACEPYRFTSDDVILGVWAERRGLPGDERPAAREVFLAKGRPCLRASDLGRRYGWGVHSDAEGRVALLGVQSAEYEQLASGRAADGSPVTVTQAMRSRRCPAGSGRCGLSRVKSNFRR